MKINTSSICQDLLKAEDIALILHIQVKSAFKVMSIINKRLKANGKFIYPARVPYDSFIDYLKTRRRGVTYGEYQNLNLLKAADVAQILHIKIRSASYVIYKLNKRAKAKGKTTYPGRISLNQMTEYLKSKKRGINYADFKKSKE